jgi:hypothetical protein
VKRAEIPRLRELYLKIEYPGNDAIPRPAEDHYVFAGEVGRSPRYAPDLVRADGSYRRQMRAAFEEHRWIPEPGQEDPVEVPVASEHNDKDMLRIIVRIPHGRSERIRGVRVEVPVRSFSWERYHSAMNQLSGFDVPAPSVIEKLRLRTKNREIDFYDETDRRTTIYRQSGG